MTDSEDVQVIEHASDGNRVGKQCRCSQCGICTHKIITRRLRQL